MSFALVLLFLSWVWVILEGRYVYTVLRCNNTKSFHKFLTIVLVITYLGIFASLGVLTWIFTVVYG